MGFPTSSISNSGLLRSFVFSKNLLNLSSPTCLAIRTNRYKYIYYHGIWDRNGFYDLENDPHERHNLIQIPQYKKKIENLRNQLFNELEISNGLNMPIRPPKGDQFYDRKIK